MHPLLSTEFGPSEVNTTVWGDAAFPVATQMSPLIAKLPLVNKPGNFDVDLEASMERDSLLEVLNLFRQHPTHLEKVAIFYKGIVNHAHTFDADASFPRVTTLGWLPDDWLASWLSSKSEIGIAMVGKCKEFDGDAIKQLVTFELGCSWALRFPHSCSKKDVIARALDMRSD